MQYLIVKIIIIFLATLLLLVSFSLIILPEKMSKISDWYNSLNEPQDGFKYNDNDRFIFAYRFNFGLLLMVGGLAMIFFSI